MKRFVSLDVFRGMTILLMILVNNQVAGGNSFYQLRHAPPGAMVTMADWAFPFFIFIMGAAMWFSSNKKGTNRTRTGRSANIIRIFKRAVILFGVGILLNWLPFSRDFADVRIPGVLQRIALAYLFGAILTLYIRRAGAILVTILLLLGGYWMLLDYAGTEIVDRFDQFVFGSRHLLHPRFDPEGLLSTIPVIAQVLIGYLAASAVGKTSNMSGGTITLILLGLLVGAGGYFLGYVWPIEKPYWSGSYVLYTSGLAMVIWGVLSFIIEYMQAVKWSTFFNVAGTNSLYIYSLSMVLAKLFGMWGVTSAVYGFFQSYMLPDNFASLLWSITMLLICWLLTWPLYRGRIFISA